MHLSTAAPAPRARRFLDALGALGNGSIVAAPKLTRTMLLAAVLGGFLPHGSARARKQDEYHYPFDRVWNTALRLVRVDMRLPVTDRDPEAGYLLFEYVDHGKRYPGSIELVKGERDQRPLVTAVVQVPGMPSYVEQMVLDKLEKKLKEELGEPMQPVKPEPEKPKEPEKKPNRDDDNEPPSEPEAPSDDGDRERDRDRERARDEGDDRNR